MSSVTPAAAFEGHVDDDLGGGPLFDIEGVKGNTLPTVDVPVGTVVRYHIRKGPHDITLYDWQQYIKHADSVFRK